MTSLSSLDNKIILVIWLYNYEVVDESRYQNKVSNIDKEWIFRLYVQLYMELSIGLYVYAITMLNS